MQLINVNGTYINLDYLVFARTDKGIDGKLKLRVSFSGGAEMQLMGEAACSLLGHLEALAVEPLSAPGLASLGGGAYRMSTPLAGSVGRDKWVVVRDGVVIDADGVSHYRYRALFGPVFAVGAVRGIFPCREDAERLARTLTEHNIPFG